MLNRSLVRGKALNASLFLHTNVPDLEKAAACFEESMSLFQALSPQGKQGMAYTLLLGAIAHVTDRVEAMLEQSLALYYETGDQLGISECLIRLADHAEFDGDYEKATSLVEAHLAIRRELGDQDGIAAALLKLGTLAFSWNDDYEQAVTFFEESLSCFRSIRKKSGVSWVLANYGGICLWYGDHAQAARNFEEGSRLAQDVGENFLCAINSYGLGITKWFHGNYADAMQTIKDSMAVANDLEHWGGVAVSLHTLGDIALAKGDEQTAVQSYEQEMTLSEEQHIRPGIIFGLGGLGKVAWSKRDYDLATTRFKESLLMLPEKAPDIAKFNAFVGLGRVAQSRGDIVEARAYYREVLGIYRQRTAHPSRWTSIKTRKALVAYPLDALAVLAAAQGQLEHAACLFGAVEAIYPALRYEMPAVERAERDQAVAAVRAALGKRAFAEAGEKGHRMTVDEAIAYALKEFA
jgi:tetratricopeptide (TPR) repeat protein